MRNLPQELHEINWKYVGAGWFRDGNIPKGAMAQIVHAPELVEQLLKKIEKLENEVQSYFEELAGEDI